MSVMNPWMQTPVRPGRHWFLLMMVLLLSPALAAAYDEEKTGVAKRPGAEIALIVICAAIGAVFDSVLVSAGLVSYTSGMFSESLAPYWIIGMWILFATTLNLSLSFLKGRLLLASAMGFVAGPMAYLGGAKLGGITLVDTNAALLALAIGWAVIMPGLTMLADRFNGFAPSEPAAELR